MIQVTEIQAKSILSPASGYIGAYDYTLSATQGCLFGCAYCYVPTLYFHRRFAATWGETLAVKPNAVELLRRDGMAGKLGKARIYWSPNTDPLQPHEVKLRPQERLFNRLLEVFAEFPPRLLMIQTRAPWITEHTQLLKNLGSRVVVAMSITTDDDEIRKAFEPSCASIAKRVGALAGIHEAGIRTQASLAPLLPCDPEALATLVEPHADWVVVQAMKMKGPGARTWAPALEIVKRMEREGWLQGGAEATNAMNRLREALGPKLHEGQEGFSFAANQRKGS